MNGLNEPLKKKIKQSLKCMLFTPNFVRIRPLVLKLLEG
jgi:hypothetical protein